MKRSSCKPSASHLLRPRISPVVIRPRPLMRLLIPLRLTIASPPSLFSIPTPSIVPSSRLPSPTPGLCAICLFRSPSSCRSLISPSYTLGPCRSPS